MSGLQPFIGASIILSTRSLTFLLNLRSYLRHPVKYTLSICVLMIVVPIGKKLVDDFLQWILLLVD